MSEEDPRTRSAVVSSNLGNVIRAARAAPECFTLDEVFARRQAAAQKRVSEEAVKYYNNQGEAETVARRMSEKKHSTHRKRARKGTLGSIFEGIEGTYYVQGSGE